MGIWSKLKSFAGSVKSVTTKIFRHELTNSNDVARQCEEVSAEVITLQHQFRALMIGLCVALVAVCVYVLIKTYQNYRSTKDDLEKAHIQQDKTKKNLKDYVKKITELEHNKENEEKIFELVNAKLLLDVFDLKECISIALKRTLDNLKDNQMSHSRNRELCGLLAIINVAFVFGLANTADVTAVVLFCCVLLLMSLCILGFFASFFQVATFYTTYCDFENLQQAAETQFSKMRKLQIKLLLK